MLIAYEVLAEKVIYPASILLRSQAILLARVADGVTKLLLQLEVDEPGDVTVTIQGTGNQDEDGILQSYDLSQKGAAESVRLR